MFDTFTLAAAVTDLDAVDPAPTPADAVEFRMDLADDPLVQLERYEGQLPIIATNRARCEGGEAEDDGRLGALEAALDHPRVRAIDIELAAVEEGAATDVLSAAEDREAAVIVSWHDFDGTPSHRMLRERLEAAAAAGDVGKAAVMADTPADVLPVLQVTHALASQGIAVATMSMGEAGRHSRVIAPIYGSRIAYAPPESDDATAPGQYDLATLAGLIEALS